MDKLLKLLIEFDPQRNNPWWTIHKYWEPDEKDWVLSYNWTSMEYSVMLLISKHYGFIERLVKEKKLKEPHWDFRIVNYFELDYEELRTCDSDYWYMVLATQKEPIEYLLSYLK